MEVIRENRPSASTLAMALIMVIAVALFGMAAAFAYLLLAGQGNNYLLGTLLAFEFLLAGFAVVLYGRFFIAFREVSEEREEGLLW